MNIFFLELISSSQVGKREREEDEVDEEGIEERSGTKIYFLGDKEFSFNNGVQSFYINSLAKNHHRITIFYSPDFSATLHLGSLKKNFKKRIQKDAHQEC